jgi:aryl-alcohol dehydrogenase-like predicted oxidoreductase
MEIQKRRLGRTGFEATILGLGGEGVLRTFGHEKDAYALINRAVDLGINYFESARAYSGSESYYGLALREQRNRIFLNSKSHARDRKGALEHLQATLKNMRTDHLDLWQVHDVRTEDDIRMIFGPGGALEAFVEAREKGYTRFIGVTGHHDTAVIMRCMELFDFDTVLLPVNPAETLDKGFIREVIPLAVEKDMGVIAMKVFFRGLASRLPGWNSLGPLLRFALSQPVSTAVIGCDDIVQLEKNHESAAAFTPMPGEDMAKLVGSISPYARQLMYYKP